MSDDADAEGGSSRSGADGHRLASQHTVPCGKQDEGSGYQGLRMDAFRRVLLGNDLKVYVGSIPSR
jgi:hypothetical protein